MRILWLTDPWESLDHERDTTLRLAAEALELGVECHWADVRELACGPAGAVVSTRCIVSMAAGRAKAGIVLGLATDARPSDFEQVHFRTDPPVDLGYLHPVSFLRYDAELRAAEHPAFATEFVNPLDVLQGYSEKMFGLLGPDHLPPSVASASFERLRAFGRREGRTIAKPLHQCQSRGIELLDWRSDGELERNQAALATLTSDFTRPALLQRFLGAVHDGETRLWLVDGRLLAHARKRPAAGTYRIDMDQGGTLRAAELTARELAAVPAIERELQRLRVRLAAVDLIDGWVTDFNVTSPGLLVQMEALTGRNLARPIMEALMRPYGATAS